MPVLHLLSRPRGRPDSADPGPALPALGGGGDRALRLLHRLPVGPRQRAAGRRPAGCGPRRATARSSTPPATTARSSTLCSATCTVAGADDADALRRRPRRCTSSTGGSDRRGPRGDAALRVRRHRSWPRTSTATPSAGSGCLRSRCRSHATRAPPATSAASPSRSPTRRSRRSTRRSTDYQQLMKASHRPRGPSRLAAAPRRRRPDAARLHRAGALPRPTRGTCQDYRPPVFGSA